MLTWFLAPSHLLLVGLGWAVLAVVVAVATRRTRSWHVATAVGGAVVLRSLLLLAVLAVRGPGGYWFVFWTEPGRADGVRRRVVRPAPAGCWPAWCGRWPAHVRPAACRRVVRRHVRRRAARARRAAGGGRPRGRADRLERPARAAARGAWRGSSASRRSSASPPRCRGGSWSRAASGGGRAGRRPTRWAASRRETYDDPAGAVAAVDQAVVQPARPPLPELHDLGRDDVAAPLRRGPGPRPRRSAARSPRRTPTATRARRSAGTAPRPTRRAGHRGAGSGSRPRPPRRREASRDPRPGPAVRAGARGRAAHSASWRPARPPCGRPGW